MNILRSVLAVLLGYAVFAVPAVLLFRIAGLDPHAQQTLGFTVFAVVYGMVFAGLGGLLAVRIGSAKGTGTLHAACVAFMIALGATVSLVASSGARSAWSQLTALVLMAPSAWGAAFLARRVQRQAGWPR